MNAASPEPLNRRQRAAAEKRARLAAAAKARAAHAEEMAEEQAPAAQRKPALGPDGCVLREPVATPDSPRHGFRRVWTIDLLHDASPREFTKAIVATATRLLNDYEIGEVGAKQGGANFDRVDGSVADGMNPWSPQLVSLRRYQEAMAVLGWAGGLIVKRAVILNWSLTQLALHMNSTRDNARGALRIMLERLREHYYPPRQDAPARGATEAVEAPADMDGLSLPQDRVGRWRVPGGDA